jgi:V-type H+-transporting ATPase subunit D
MEAAKFFAEEQQTEKISLKKGVSMSTAHNLLLAGGDRDPDVIF